MILVMGGAGYIGSHTVKYILNQGFECLVADNLSYGHKEAIDKRAQFFFADLMDVDSLKKLFSTYNIDAVIHFAAFTYVGESVHNPRKYYANNVVGTLNLLNTMLDFGVDTIVFSSTCATYGEPEYMPLNEDHPQRPINPYGQTKLMIEKILADYHSAYGLNYIALRYFNAAGADSNAQIGESHSPETHLIPLVLAAIKNKESCINIFGTDYPTPDGTCIRDYIHVEDLASAHLSALKKASVYTGGLNLGTGIGYSVKEVIKAAELITNSVCPVHIAERRQGDPAVLYADNTKAKQVLEWSPVFDNIEDIIQTAWNWENNRSY